jgi:hypothetical protein
MYIYKENAQIDLFQKEHDMQNVMDYLIISSSSFPCIPIYKFTQKAYDW